jgi:hypothetical protein
MIVQPFNKLVDDRCEIWRVLKRLPHPEPDGPWLAGGAVWKSIENWPVNHDLDFFFKNKEQLDRWKRLINSIPYCNCVVGEEDKYYNTTYLFHINDKDYNKTIAIQFISFKFWSSLVKVLEEFDFTACQFGYDGENLVAPALSFQDLKDRVIRLNKVEDPLSTALHLKKYLEKGFNVLESEKQKVEKILKASRDTAEKSGYSYPRPAPPITNIASPNAAPPVQFASQYVYSQYPSWYSTVQINSQQYNQQYNTIQFSTNFDPFEIHTG